MDPSVRSGAVHGSLEFSVSTKDRLIPEIQGTWSPPSRATDRPEGSEWIYWCLEKEGRDCAPRCLLVESTEASEGQCGG